jgi:ubiquinone/menaquinone biosynthesis C-methylase UbiE
VRLLPQRPLRSRSREHELLDAQLLDERELRRNLRDLGRMNRLPGGTAASIAAIERLADGQRDLCVLDLGVGGGQMARAFARHGRGGASTRWQVLAVDAHPQVLEVARGRLRGERDVELLLADVRELPLADGSVDIAHASLLLHHLDPSDAVAALGEMTRVARRGVVINDLRRGILPYLVISGVTLAIASSPWTRQDGPLSVRRAYRLRELDELLHAAGLRPVMRSSPLLPRVVTGAVPI